MPAGRIMDVDGIMLHGPGTFAIGDTMSHVKRGDAGVMHYIAITYPNDGDDHLLDSL